MSESEFKTDSEIEAEFAGLLLACYSEMAPEGWEMISFKYERKGSDAGGRQIIEFGARVCRKVDEGHIVDRIEPTSPLAPAAIVGAYLKNMEGKIAGFSLMRVDLYKKGKYDIRYDTRF